MQLVGGKRRGCLYLQPDLKIGERGFHQKGNVCPVCNAVSLLFCKKKGGAERN